MKAYQSAKETTDNKESQQAQLEILKNDRLVPLFSQKARNTKEWLHPPEAYDVDTKFEVFNDIPRYNSKYTKSVYDAKVVNMHKMICDRPRTDMRGVVIDYKNKKIEQGQK